MPTLHGATQSTALLLSTSMVFQVYFPQVLIQCPLKIIDHLLFHQLYGCKFQVITRYCVEKSLLRPSLYFSTVC